MQKVAHNAGHIGVGARKARSTWKAYAMLCEIDQVLMEIFEFLMVLIGCNFHSQGVNPPLRRVTNDCLKMLPSCLEEFCVEKRQSLFKILTEKSTNFLKIC